MFAFQNVPRQANEFPGIAVSPIDVKNETAKYDLSLYMWDEPRGLAARLEYNTDLFDSASMKRMLIHLETLLQAIIRDPEQRLSDLALLSDGERAQIVVEWNDTERELPPGRLVHELFEAQAMRSPDRVALVFEGSQMTYGELDARANRLANYLSGRGVRPETAVGICMERSCEMVVAVLGVLKAGGLYVPLDPSHPRDRLKLILQNAGIRLLLTQEKIARDFWDLDIPVVRVDSDQRAIERASTASPDIVIDPNNLAYVIYTSGSTGTPKGVEVSHRAVVNFLLSIRERPGMSAGDILLAVTTLSFDWTPVVEFNAELQSHGHAGYPGDMASAPGFGMARKRDGQGSVRWRGAQARTRG
jgi:non-ribosomal peptide synthetase component F